MINQGAKLKSNKRCLGKIYGRNGDIFVKFASACEKFINFFPQ